MKISLKRKHALFLLGLVLLQACLCPVNAARRSGRRSRKGDNDDDNKSDNMLTKIPGNVVELIMVLGKMIVSPLTWQKELCKPVWEEQNKRKTPKSEKLTIMSVLKQVLVNNIGDIILIVQSMFKKPDDWKKEYCMKVIELEKEKKQKGEK